jgi:3-deoxy-7-phosphoheptulonate synthase
MSFVYKKKLPTPEEIIDKLPLSKELQDLKAERDREIKNIFIGRDNRLIVIIGPCSAHNEDAVSEYVSRLARLQEKVCDRLVIIPRIYTNKPRSTGDGYKGMLHQP